MLEALTPFNERERLSALHRLAILDTPCEERFDRLTRLAQRLLEVPIALVSLVDENRQWFKSCQGLSAEQTPRSISFCGHAILEDDTLIIPDAWEDCRFADNPLVTGEPHIRFYAGHPIKTTDGYRLGTLCLIDRRPRMLTAADRQMLRDLAVLVENELNAVSVDRRINDITEETRRLHAVVNSAFEHMAEGIIIVDANRKVLSVNQAFEQITGYTRDEIIGQGSGFYLPGQHSSDIQTLLRQNLADKNHWQGEIWTRRKNGTIYPIWLSVTAIRDDQGHQTHIVAVFNDLSQLKEQEERLHFLSHHDALTRLPNRTAFQAAVNEALDRVQQTQQGRLSVLSIGLDRFRTINESLGFIAGDRLLTTVAERLTLSVRDSDIISRKGGDEFGVFLASSGRFAEDNALIAQRILAALAEPFTFDGHELFLSASIGISAYPADGTEAGSLLGHAEVAMHRAKKDGGNTYRFYSIEMNHDAFQRLMLSNQLRQALKRNELLLHYQPQVELASGRITGMEALLRWQHPEKGWIPPLSFIPLAEEIGVIVPLGEWVIKTACEQIGTWQAGGFSPPRVAVNLSARQFREPDLVQRIAAILSETGIDPVCLELEITESMAMDDPEMTEATLHQLKALGLSIALDDFGTGYSSLTYLKRFPIDYLKIDRSFVRDVPQDADDTAITRTVIAMAKSLGLRVIAEGVETEEQRRFLLNEGCDEYQGYLFSKPQGMAEITQLLIECDKRYSPVLGESLLKAEPQKGQLVDAI